MFLGPAAIPAARQERSAWKNSNWVDGVSRRDARFLASEYTGAARGIAPPRRHARAAPNAVRQTNGDQFVGHLVSAVPPRDAGVARRATAPSPHHQGRPAIHATRRRTGSCRSRQAAQHARAAWLASRRCPAHGIGRSAFQPRPPTRAPDGGAPADGPLRREANVHRPAPV